MNTVSVNCCEHSKDGWCTKCVKHWLYNSITPCGCSCHVEGWNIKHIVACCNMCGESYLYVPEGTAALDADYKEKIKLDGPLYLKLIAKKEIEKIKCKKCKAKTL